MLMIRSLLSVFIAISLLTGCRETQRVRYATFADAERDRAPQRGWIPVWMPHSATDIEEVHDLDVNTQRLAFRVPPADVPRLTEALAPASLAQVWPPDVRSPALEGEWPLDAAVANGAAAKRLSTYITRDSSSASSCVAIDRAASKVYAWSCTRPAR